MPWFEQSPVVADPLPVQEVTLRQGDRLSAFAAVIRDEYGTPLDLTDARAFMTLSPLTPTQRGPMVERVEMTIEAPATDGLVTYDWQASETMTASPGVYDVRITVEYGADTLLQQAVLWLDAENSVEGEQAVVNYGTGGSALNARYGSTTGSDSNDPILATHTGENYIRATTSHNDRLTSNSTTRAADCSFDVRVDLVRPNSPSAQRRVFEDPWYMDCLTNNNVNCSFLDTAPTTYPGIAVSAATVNAVVAAGGRIHLRMTWDASTDTLALYGRAPGEALTSDTGWTLLGSGVKTGEQVATTSIATRLGCSIALSSGFDGKIFGYYATVNGGVVHHIDSTVLTDSGATSIVDRNGVSWTVDRATTGRKLAIVTRPVWLFGADDYMEIADNDLLDFGATDSFTVLAVARRWGTQEVEDTIVAKKNSSSVFATGWWMASNLTPNVRFNISDGSLYEDISTTSAVLGKLDVLAGVRDRAADTVTVIRNGLIESSSTDDTTATLANTSPTRIGWVASTAYGDMELVAIAVFRRALSADEIAAINSHYNNIASSETYASRTITVPSEDQQSVVYLASSIASDWFLTDATGALLSDGKGGFEIFNPLLLENGTYLLQEDGTYILV